MKRGVGITFLGLALLAPVPASAYTLVLRSGGRVDIGESYRLDGSRIEYRSSAGEARRLELADVDLQATARANGESVSAFVDRASKRATAPDASSHVARQTDETAVSVTNADLEPYRVEREQLDADYQARHPEVLRAPRMPVPANDDRARQAATVEQQWRDEARAFRDQIDAEQSQINGIRDDIADRQKYPFKYGLDYRYNFGNTPIIRRGGQYYSATNPLYPSLRAEEEFSQLNSRLIDLEIQHRATLSRWNSFLERARRAGVPPGWLRE